MFVRIHYQSNDYKGQRLKAYWRLYFSKKFSNLKKTIVTSILFSLAKRNKRKEILLT